GDCPFEDGPTVPFFGEGSRRTNKGVRSRFRGSFYPLSTKEPLHENLAELVGASVPIVSEQRGATTGRTPFASLQSPVIGVARGSGARSPFPTRSSPMTTTCRVKLLQRGDSSSATRTSINTARTRFLTSPSPSRPARLR